MSHRVKQGDMTRREKGRNRIIREIGTRGVSFPRKVYMQTVYFCRSGKTRYENAKIQDIW